MFAHFFYPRGRRSLDICRQQLINARFSLSRTEPVPFGQFPLLLGLVFSAAISPFPLPSDRPHRADRRSARVAGSSLSARMTLGNGRNHSPHARNGANIPASPYGSGDLEPMEHAKFANGSGHKLPIGRSPSPAEQDLMDAARLAGGKKAVRKKAAPRKAKPAGPVPAENSLPRKIGTAAEVKSDQP